MSKRIKPLMQAFTISLILITSALLGCSQIEQSKTSPAAAVSPSQQESQKIINDASFAADQVRSYKLDLNLTMIIRVNSDGIVPGGGTTTSAKTTVSTSLKAERDRAAQMSHASVSMSTTWEGSPGTNTFSAELFYTPANMYSKTTAQWTREPYRADTVTLGEKELEEQLTLLKSFTDVKFLRYEMLGGVDNYVFDLTPDPLKATSWFLKRSVFGIEGNPENEVKNLKNLTYTAWIGVSTLLLNSVNLHYSWEYNDYSGVNTDGTGAEVIAAVGIYDYNKSLNLTPPTDIVASPSIPATSSSTK